MKHPFAVVAVTLVVLTLAGGAYFFSRDTRRAPVADPARATTTRPAKPPQASSTNPDRQRPKPAAACSPSSPSFTCAPVTQGYESPNPQGPMVCGCAPISCPADRPFSVTSAAAGTWPDGSGKGTFTCSADLPA